MAQREVLQLRISRLEASRDRAVLTFNKLIERCAKDIEALELEQTPANTNRETPPTRPDPVLPSPSTPPDAPSLEEAPELQRYVPTAEILALTAPADVLTALGKLATPREEHELLSAWTVAGNRAALTAVSVHLTGSLAERATRSLKRLGPAEDADQA